MANGEYSYVIEMLTSASDDVLADLDAYLDPASAETLAPEPARIEADPNSPWTTGGFRLFLTHLSAQKANAASLRDALTPHGIETFVAHQDIRPTRQWESVMRSALANRKSFQGSAALTPLPKSAAAAQRISAVTRCPGTTGWRRRIHTNAGPSSPSPRIQCISIAVAAKLA